MTTMRWMPLVNCRSWLASKIIYAAYLEPWDERKRILSVDLIRVRGSFTLGNNVLRSFERRGVQKKGREMNDSIYITQRGPHVRNTSHRWHRSGKLRGRSINPWGETQARKVECSREGGFRGLIRSIDPRVLFGTPGIMVRWWRGNSNRIIGAACLLRTSVFRIRSTRRYFD